jgi:hypothetical protein
MSTIHAKYFKRQAYDVCLADILIPVEEMSKDSTAEVEKTYSNRSVKATSPVAIVKLLIKGAGSEHQPRAITGLYVPRISETRGDFYEKEVREPMVHVQVGHNRRFRVQPL